MEERKWFYYFYLSLPCSEKDLDTWKTIKVAIHGNMAACYLQKKEYNNTKDACRLVSIKAQQSNPKALELDESNPKALWRYAKALRGQDQYEEAIKCLQKAEATVEVQKELEALKLLKAKKDKADQQVRCLFPSKLILQAFGGFFNKLGSEGLYEGKAPEGPLQWKCHLCGEEMDQIQQARHIIKKHSPPNPNKQKF